MPYRDDFLNALENLGKSVQQYGLSQAVSQANERVQDIKANMRPGVEQRQALSSLAQDVFLRLQSGGADPQTAALVYQNLTPKTPNSIEQALLSDDPYERQAAKEIQNEQELRTARRDMEKFQFQMQLTDKLEQGRDRRAELAATRAENRAAMKPSAQNQKAAAYATQLVSSNSIFNSLGTGYGSSLLTEFNKVSPQLLRTSSFEKAQQAKLEFINAIARPESGATIKDEELARYDKMYFPQAGEGDAVIAQKARARSEAIQKTLIEAGPAASLVQDRPGLPSALGTNMVDLSQGFKPIVDPSKYARPARRR